MANIIFYKTKSCLSLSLTRFEGEDRYSCFLSISPALARGQATDKNKYNHDEKINVKLGSNDLMKINYFLTMGEESTSLFHTFNNVDKTIRLMSQEDGAVTVTLDEGASGADKSEKRRISFVLGKEEALYVSLFIREIALYIEGFKG